MKVDFKMKKIILLLAASFLFMNNAWAEGIWSVNGYQLSNVNILDRSSQIEVSGRIQNGEAADYLKIQILVSNDNGFRCWAETSIQHYCGKGELFTARFKYRRKARSWNIEKIQVTGNKVSKNDVKKYYTPAPVLVETKINKPTEIKQTFPETSEELKSYPMKENFSNNTSKVLFSSFNYISVLIRNKDTNKVVLMKSISPHTLEEIQMERGRYIAKIQGDGNLSEKEFEIKEAEEIIRFD